MRAAIYARYSTDLQRDASIEDQIRVCREFAERQGWNIVECYTDHAISGATMMRPGLQMLLAHTLERRLDVIVSEALDRLSRDQADTAEIFKRTQFADVSIHTLSEGEVSALHVGLTGTMNALQLKEIARKVRRGLRGRIESGKSAGGLPYGYEVVRKLDSSGNPIRGERRINEAQAHVVRRILREYAAGRSPKSIAAQLNKEGVPGPMGNGWSQSSINGNRRRGIGILNNEIYIGVLVWNRQRFIKNPDTGKRVTRYNPEADWIRQKVPDLRIVDDEIWEKVKERQKEITEKDEFWQTQRPTYLLSGLLKCGCCGGSFTKANHNRYGCATVANKGTCHNKLKVKQEELEQVVLRALQKHLMNPALCQIFCEEYVRHMNELRRQHNAVIEGHKAELRRLAKEKEQIIEAIKAGVPGGEVADAMKKIARRRGELEKILEKSDEVPVVIHPNMASHYRREVESLTASLKDENCRVEAAALLRSLVDKIVLTPNDTNSALCIDLHGDLAGILSIAMDRQKPLAVNDLTIAAVKLVAEEGLEPPTRGL